jgi:peptide/nickel transport system permease protein
VHVDYWAHVKQSNAGRAGLILVCLLVGVAVLAPVLSPWDPGAYTGAIFSPPGRDHWLGTNDVGQDIWAQLLFGARTSLAVGCGAALLATLLSVLIGGTAGLLGGLYDRFWMRAVDALLVIPPVIPAILVAAYLRPNLAVTVILLAAILWPGEARVVRAQILSLKERAPVAAARTFGAGWGHILVRHLIPELGAVLVAVFVQGVRRAVFLEAGLSFLGIGDPAVESWGRMMQHALRFTYLDVWKWWLLPPGLALSLTLGAFALLGFALETVFHPRLRR